MRVKPKVSPLKEKETRESEGRMAGGPETGPDPATVRTVPQPAATVKNERAHRTPAELDPLAVKSLRQAVVTLEQLASKGDVSPVQAGRLAVELERIMLRLPPLPESSRDAARLRPIDPQRT